MDIKSLPQSVRDYLRSGVNINSVTQCVTELVLNSLDAKSNAIAVRLNLVTLRVQVVDNGNGVSKENFKSLGLRYRTNKCHSVEDLKRKLKQYGFRGEAIASICKQSQKVNITSRARDTDNTYSKSFENSKWNKVNSVNKSRPSFGTTVTIENFLYNIPVRQKKVNQSLDLEEIKRSMMCLAIIHPSVSFSLRNDTTGKIILQSHKCSDVGQAFNNLYPEIKQDEFIRLKVSKCRIAVSGLIATKASKKNKLQLIYVNRRPIHSPKIQQLIVNLLTKGSIFNKANEKKSDHYNNFLPCIEKNQYPVYVINITCPYSHVDLMLHPSKTLVEFKDWNIVLTCTEKLIKHFLKRENVSQKNCGDEVVGNEEVVLNDFRSQFGVSQILGAVKGLPVKRKLAEDCTTPSKMNKLDSINIESVKQMPDVCEKVNADTFFGLKLLNVTKNEEDKLDLPEIEKNDFQNNSEFVNEFPHQQPNVFDKYTNTQSLLINSDIDGITNSDSDIENQKKGKDLIMDIFLKSTQLYSKDDDDKSLHTNVIVKTQKGVITGKQDYNTTMTVSYKIKTILNQTVQKINDIPREKMISKSIQATIGTTTVSKGLQTTTIAGKEFKFNVGNNQLTSPFFAKPNIVNVRRKHKLDETVSKYFCKPEKFETKKFNPIITCHNNYKAFTSMVAFGEKRLNQRKVIQMDTSNFFQNNAFKADNKRKSCTKHKCKNQFSCGNPKETAQNYECANDFIYPRKSMTRYVSDYNFDFSNAYQNTRVPKLQTYDNPQYTEHFMYEPNYLNQMNSRNCNETIPIFSSYKYNNFHHKQKSNFDFFKQPQELSLFQFDNKKHNFDNFNSVQDQNCFSTNFETNNYFDFNNERIDCEVTVHSPHTDEKLFNYNNINFTTTSLVGNNNNVFIESCKQPPLKLHRAQKKISPEFPVVIKKQYYPLLKDKRIGRISSKEEVRSVPFPSHIEIKGCDRLPHKPKIDLFPDIKEVKEVKKINRLSLLKKAPENQFASSRNETKRSNMFTYKPKIDLLPNIKKIMKARNRLALSKKAPENKFASSHNETKRSMFIYKPKIDLMKKFRKMKKTKKSQSNKNPQHKFSNLLSDTFSKMTTSHNLINKSNILKKKVQNISSNVNEANLKIVDFNEDENDITLNFETFQPQLSSTLIDHANLIPGNQLEMDALEQDKECDNLIITLNESNKMKIMEKDLKFACNAPESITSFENTLKPVMAEEMNSGNGWIHNINNLGNPFWIHARTGMTTFLEPNYNNHFNLKKRNEMLPKGLSPFIPEMKKVDTSLSPASKRSLYLTLLQSYENILLTVKWENYIHYTDPKFFFDQLYKEKCKLFEPLIPSILDSPLSKDVHLHKFDKDIFTNVDVIGQLDKKFIVTFDRMTKMIVIFDQHAVHERIRLEKLCEEYIERSKYTSVNCDVISISLSEDDLAVLHDYKSTFESFGLTFEIYKNKISVTKIPTCLHNEITKSINSKMEGTNLTVSLIQETIDLLRTTRGAAARNSTILQSIINSEACRGAIKFGEELTKERCVNYVNDVGKCILPFQCAHGRPTLVPILDLHKVKNFNKKISKINYNRLRV